MTLRSALAITITFVCLRGTPLVAQGHQGVPPGQAKKITPPSAGTHTSSPAPDGGIDSAVTITPRALGAWLDDATVLPPGSTWMSISTNRWLSPAGRGNDSPIVDVMSTLTPRVQVNVTLPYSRFSDETGTTWSGLGDMYFTTKVVVRSAERGVGLAVAPALEWSTGASAFEPAEGRVHWVLPVNAEVRGSGWRMYGSGGYFTRGALFAAGAFERSITDRWTATGSLTQSWSTSDQAAADAYGLSRRRTDASGGAAYSVSPALMVFASVSRTLSRIEYDSSRLAVNAGASVRLAQR